MLALALLHQVRVVDQSYQIPPNNWRYVDAADWHAATQGWRDSPAIVHASFLVESGASVRLLLLDREHLEEMRQGAPPAALQSTPLGRAGTLSAETGAPGDCVLVLENRGSPQTAIVHLQVMLDSWNAGGVSRDRKVWVLALSFAFFFATVSYSAAKLWRVFRR